MPAYLSPLEEGCVRSCAYARCESKAGRSDAYPSNTARPAALQLSTAFPPLYYVRPLLFVLLEGSTPPSGYGSEEGPFAYAFSGTCGLACAPGGLPDARGFP